MKLAQWSFIILGLLPFSAASTLHSVDVANDLIKFNDKYPGIYGYESTTETKKPVAEPAKEEIKKISSTNTEKKKVDSKQSVKSNIPAGFEGINNNYNGVVNLLDNHHYIGQENIAYYETDDYIVFSKEAKDKIIKYFYEKLNDEGKLNVAKALMKKMPATTKLQKFYAARSDNKVTCHFDYNKLTLYILIPNKYLKDNSIVYEHRLYHPDPTFYTPALTSSIGTYYRRYSATESLSWQTNGRISSGRSSIIYELNDSVTEYVNNLYVEYQGKKYTYDIGYQEPGLTTASLINPNGNFWGIFVNENARLLNPKFYSSYKTPFILTVSRPYNVQIKYRGKILYQGDLLQGDNVIDTSKFPQGTYSIDIIKRDMVTNEVQTTTQIFSQQASKYNWIYSGTQIVAGLESDYFKSASTDKKLYLHAKKGYSLLDGEADIFYTFANNTNYLGASYDALSTDNINYSLAASISEKIKAYVYASSVYNNNKYSISANIYSGFAGNFDGDRSEYASLQYRYNTNDWSFNASGNYNFSGNTSLSSSISRTSTISDVPLRTYLTIQYSDSSSFNCSLGLSISLDLADNIKYNNSISYASEENSYNIRSSMTYSDSDNKLTASDNLYLSTDGNNYNLASVTYKADEATYTGTLNMNKAVGGTGANSSTLSLNTNLYLTPSTYIFSRLSPNAGYLIKTPTIKDSPNTKFVVNSKILGQNEKTLISASVFNSRSLEIVPDNVNYKLKTKDWNEFFYPGNFLSPDPEIQKTCLVSFYADIPKKYNYSFVGMEDDFYGSGQQKSIAQMTEGKKLTYVYISENNKKCETDVVVNCTSKYIDLGKISCNKKA